MKFVNFHNKSISVFVAIVFMTMLCFWANQTPAAPSAPATEKSSTPSLDKSDTDGTGFIEQEDTAPAAKKGKKFPWLIVALVVVAGGAVLYFTVLKKKNYTLTVNAGEGVTGTPASGTSSHKKGTVVNYNFAAQSGYGGLTVTLDGAAVAASGSVTMNANHALEAKATKFFTLTVNKGAHVTGTPNSGTYSYAPGTVVNYNYAAASGYSGLAVRLDGAAVAASGAITMNADHTLDSTSAKTYYLTVSKGAHVVGLPASGTYSYTEGTNVSYSYAAESGYSNLVVKLDGSIAAGSGTITMSADHSLAANLNIATIEVNSTPAGARIYMGNKDSGFSTPHAFTYPAAVTKTILLRYSCGYKDYVQTVSVIPGQTMTISATREAGIKEDFDVPASSCWKTFDSGWGITGSGQYVFSGNPSGYWAISAYNHAFSGNYRIRVGMKKTSGDISRPDAIFLGDGTNMNDARGYVFFITLSSPASYGIYRVSDFIFSSESGPAFTIKSMTPSAAIHAGLGAWNWLSIVKTGTTYAFLINDVLQCTITDSLHDTSYIWLAEFTGTKATTIQYEGVYLDPTT